MKKLNNLLDKIASPFELIAPWLLRLTLGVSFILHGIGKFPIPSPDMVRWFESMGYMLPAGKTKYPYWVEEGDKE